MIGHSYGMDSQAKAAELAKTILAAASAPQIASACSGVEDFLQKHTPDQCRWFFSVTFPTLICKTFGFDESSSSLPKSQSPNGWIDFAMLYGDSELAGKIFNLLSPDGVLFSSISAVDKLCLVKYAFPVERLPEWVRYMLQNKRDCQVLMDLCPLFRNKVKEDLPEGLPCQVQLNVLEYFLFWFVYYPVCRGNSEGPDGSRVRSKKFRLENWAYSIPGLCSSKRGMEQKNDVNLYCRLMYAYLRAFVPMDHLNAHQPYRSSLLHYSWGHDTSVTDRAEFLVNSFVHFWLVDNDFSPVPVSLCKSYGVTLPFRSVFGEAAPTSGLGEVITLFVKYVTLNSVLCIEGHDKFECNGYPPRKVSGSVDQINPKELALDLAASNSWNIRVQRPLYRFILRTFLFCPLESSIKNVSQVFTVWVTYMEPWKVSLEEFAELDSTLGKPQKSTSEVTQTNAYSPCWQSYVLANYLYYSSLVMHFFGFAHKFLHTDPQVIVQMVSKVIHILTSSTELMDLIKNVDTAYHSKPTGSSRLVPNGLYRYVPAIREQLQDWENGLCERDADGSFLHDNWNKDLRLFSGGEDGGQQLLQLFVLRAESELQALSGNNIVESLKCLDSLKAQLSCLFGMPIWEQSSRTPEKIEHVQARDEMFRPKSFGHLMVPEVKYKGEWMKRPISDDEIAWLAKLLVDVSDWLNEILGLNQVNSSQRWPSWSYVDLSGNAGNVSGLVETSRMAFLSLFSWVIALGSAGLMFMRNHGLKVNLRILASKKILMVLLMVAAFRMMQKSIRAALP